MKKFFRSIIVIAAAAVAFSSCVQEKNVPAFEEKTVQFVANTVSTKTAFGELDGDTYPTLWTDNDSKVKISLNYASPADVSITPSEDYSSAHFNATITDDESGSYRFYSLSPASAYLSIHATNKYIGATIPTDQTPLETSVDEAAQILYAISDEYTEFPETVGLYYWHFTAYGKMTLSNLDLGDAVVSSIALTSSVPFAGRWNCYPETKTFAANSASGTITLNTTSVSDVWFACAPVDMSGETLKVVVNTDKGTFSKEVTLPEGRSFEPGKISKFTIDMSGVTIQGPKVYNLVTDASELTVGSEVIIAAANANVAISTTQNNNNRAQTSVSKSDDKSTISDPSSDVQLFTIEAGSVAGTVAFNTGSGYIYAASSGSNYLRTETSLSANSSWKVTVSEGVATVTAQGTNTRNLLRHNSSSSIFSCYKSSQNDVAIYKLAGTGSAALPTLDALVISATVAESNDAITVTWTDVENATSYVVSCTGQEDVTVAPGVQTASFADLSYGTYEVKVKAVADGYNAGVSSVVSLDVAGSDPLLVFKKVTTVTSGKSYLIVAESAKKTATPITTNYGYLQVVDVTISEETIEMPDQTNAYVITAVDGGYTILQSDNRYLYQTGSYNSFNVSASPSSGHIWTIEPQTDGTFKITNNSVSKYIQYSTNYTSYGSYSGVSGVMPCLYELQEEN